MRIIIVTLIISVSISSSITGWDRCSEQWVREIQGGLYDCENSNVENPNLERASWRTIIATILKSKNLFCGGVECNPKTLLDYLNNAWNTKKREDIDAISDLGLQFSDPLFDGEEIRNAAHTHNPVVLTLKGEVELLFVTRIAGEDDLITIDSRGKDRRVSIYDIAGGMSFKVTKRSLLLSFLP